MLDVSVRIGILDLLVRMRDKYGISFIYITHEETRHCCNFFPRCPNGTGECRSGKPQLEEIGENHYAACFRL
jgi:ABC-type dipeptide/oligopeptide/nickel transport system ATPase component